MNKEEYVIKRIEMIQEELDQLKRFVAGGKGKMVSLRGMWEGADISDEDIEEAKRSLFKGTKFDGSYRPDCN